MATKRKILIDYDEYQMLKKKAELYEKKHINSDNSFENKHLQSGGLNVDEIVAERVATNEFNEGLLQPEADKTSNLRFFSVEILQKY